MMTSLLTAAISFGTRHLIVIGVGLGLLFMVWKWDHNRIKSAERRGGDKVVTQVNEDAERVAAEALKARERAQLDEAFQRLRRTDCIDCES